MVVMHEAVHAQLAESWEPTQALASAHGMHG